jgi:hypothetical protein
LDETFTEPHNRHSSDPKEKVLDEAFTEPGNKHSSVPKEKVLDETFTEPGNKHSSGYVLGFHFRTRRMFVTWFCECFIQYLLFRTRMKFVVWFCEYFIQCLHALSNCKIANMSRKNPDPGSSMYDEPD